MSATFVELRMDLFPARIAVNPGSDSETVYEVTRLLVGRDELWAWAWLDDSATLVLNERIESIDGRRTIGWTAQLGDGRTVYFTRARGCGCGNPLRGWQPPFQTTQGLSL